MTETDTDKTLSTKVDDETYAWFVEQAEANFRNVAGQLRWLIDQYRRHSIGASFTGAARSATPERIPVDASRAQFYQGHPKPETGWPKETESVSSEEGVT